MTVRKAAVFVVVACLVGPAALMGRQAVLTNGSMEFGPGPNGVDPMVCADWIEFGPSAERSAEANHTSGGGHAFKAFSSDPQVGAYQDVPVTPGQSVTISAWLYTRSTDKLSGDATAYINLEFYKADNTLLNIYPLAVLTAASPADTWIAASEGPHVAPATTAYARMTCVWTWNGSATGSAYWDDCSLTVGGGPNLLLNRDFETAGVGAQSPTGIDDWQGFNDQEQSADVAKDGTKSLQLGVIGSPAPAYSGLVQMMGAMTAGDQLRMVAYAWNPSSDPLTANSRAGLKLEFSSNSTVPPPEENLAFDATDPPDTWTLVDINTNVPPAVTVARIVMIYVGDSTTTGAVHFDGAEAHRNGGGNVLLNASFENGVGGFNGIDNWTEFNTAGQSACQLNCYSPPAYNGDCTAKGEGVAVSGIYQEITVSPGEALSVRAYLYTASLPAGQQLTGGGRAGVKIEWAIGGVPGWVDIGTPGDNNTVGAVSPQDTWIPLSIDYTMPPGSSANAKFVNLIEKGTAATGRVYLDACEAVLLNRFNGADADGDNDEDLRDFAEFQRCFTGSVSGQMRWGCIVFDSDDDGDVDLTDYLYFQPRMTGPQ